MKLRYILLTLLALCLLAAPAAAAGGAGTAANPYVIQTPAELQSIQNDLSAYYVLGNDINMEGYNFVSIGSVAAPFFGSLDGQGHTISNLEISRSSAVFGLFSVISSANIKNINFENCIYTGTGSTTSDVGILYGRATTGTFEITNICVTNCKIISSGPFVGGIGGSNIGDGTLSDCKVISCEIAATSQYNAGGICGSISSGSRGANVTVKDSVVKNCYIRSYGYAAGGIGGYAAQGSGNAAYVVNNTVVNCIIHSPNAHATGGICGYVAYGNASATLNNNVVENCLIYSSTAASGGICGYIANDGGMATLNNNIVKNSTVRAPTYAGGIAGSSFSAGNHIISGCDVTNTTVQASTYAGGICPTFTRT